MPLRAWLACVWYQITAGSWVVPALMSAAAVVLAFITLALDQVDRLRWLRQFESVFVVGPEGARPALVG